MEVTYEFFRKFAERCSPQSENVRNKFIICTHKTVKWLVNNNRQKILLINLTVSLQLKFCPRNAKSEKGLIGNWQ